MIRLVATIFGGLLGLAFGSFLNVCLSRWPEDESVVSPRSHCRTCDRTLAWWENVPVVSWLALRGRCRGCGTAIGWRYPLVELAVGVFWAAAVWRGFAEVWGATVAGHATDARLALVMMAGTMIFYWLLVALAMLDAENYWLPDFLTWPGVAAGMLFEVLSVARMRGLGGVTRVLTLWVLGIAAAGLLVVAIRWVYSLLRQREGLGLGDAKLMALLAAWLGLPGALLAFGLATLIGAAVALVLLIIPAKGHAPRADLAVDKRALGGWAASKLPLGTFLCIGGIVAELWGPAIISAYLRWGGF